MLMFAFQIPTHENISAGISRATLQMENVIWISYSRCNVGTRHILQMKGASKGASKREEPFSVRTVWKVLSNHRTSVRLLKKTYYWTHTPDNDIAPRFFQTIRLGLFSPFWHVRFLDEILLDRWTDKPISFCSIFWTSIHQNNNCYTFVRSKTPCIIHGEHLSNYFTSLFGL